MTLFWTIVDPFPTLSRNVTLQIPPMLPCEHRYFPSLNSRARSMIRYKHRVPWDRVIPLRDRTLVLCMWSYHTCVKAYFHTCTNTEKVTRKQRDINKWKKRQLALLFFAYHRAAKHNARKIKVIIFRITELEISLLLLLECKQLHLNRRLLEL